MPGFIVLIRINSKTTLVNGAHVLKRQIFDNYVKSSQFVDLVLHYYRKFKKNIILITSEFEDFLKKERRWTGQDLHARLFRVLILS